MLVIKVAVGCAISASSATRRTRCEMRAFNRTKELTGMKPESTESSPVGLKHSLPKRLHLDEAPASPPGPAMCGHQPTHVVHAPPPPVNGNQQTAATTAAFTSSISTHPPPDLEQESQSSSSFSFYSLLAAAGAGSSKWRCPASDMSSNRQHPTQRLTTCSLHLINNPSPWS